MIRSALLIRGATALAAAVLVAGLATSSASARPDSGVDTQSRDAASSSCSVHEVAGHLAKCDYLTGGVALR